MPPDLGQGLVSSLDRNSANLYGSAALASSATQEARSDNPPVLTQHAEQGAFFLDRVHFTQARCSCLEHGECSVGKVPGGEPSLSAGTECLSLSRAILSEGGKSGNARPPYPPAKDSPFLPRREPRRFLARWVEEALSNGVE